MTATDELRRLLDERGVEWKGFEGDPLAFVKAETSWGEVDGWGNYNYWVAEYFDGTTLLNIGNPTPAQAVEATLGRGTCRMEPFIYEDTGAFIECSECGWQLFDADYSIDAAREWLGYCPNCGKAVRA